jgi:hypothetical protein
LAPAFNAPKKSLAIFIYGYHDNLERGHDGLEFNDTFDPDIPGSLISISTTSGLQEQGFP